MGLGVRDDSSMTKLVGVTAMLLALGAVVLMCLPTAGMRWGFDPSSGASELITWHAWFEPILPGYGLFYAPATLLAGVIGLVGLALGIRRGMPSAAVIGCLLMGAILPLLQAVFLGVVGWAAVVVPVLLALGAVLGMMQRRLAGRQLAAA